MLKSKIDLRLDAHILTTIPCPVCKTSDCVQPRKRDGTISSWECVMCEVLVIVNEEQLCDHIYYGATPRDALLMTSKWWYLKYELPSQKPT